MIALIGIGAPTHRPAGLAVLSAVPSSPAPGYCGAIVRAASSMEVEEALEWFADLRMIRPTFVFGIVAKPSHCARALGRCTVPVRPVLRPAELLDGRLPMSALQDIREYSIEGSLLEELVLLFGATVLSRRPMIESIIAHGIRGATLHSVTRSEGCSTVTVWRRLADLPFTAAVLLRWARLRAYELRLASGVPTKAALIAGGWKDPSARTKAVKRWASDPRFETFRHGV